MPPPPKHVLRLRRVQILLSALAAGLVLIAAGTVGALTTRDGGDDSGTDTPAPTIAAVTQPAPPAPTGVDASPLAAAGAAPTSPTSPTGQATTAKSATAQIVLLVNQERAASGCDPLSVDPRLTTAAQSHSQDMAKHGYFAHDTPDGKNPGQRITASGYRWRTFGENIAIGYVDPSSVMNGWMNSPDHRKNILNCAFHDIGVGLAYGDHHASYWTQDFGAPR